MSVRQSTTKKTKLAPPSVGVTVTVTVPTYERLAEVGYNAYRDSAGGKSIITGDPLPDFSKLRPDISAGWVAAAKAIAGVLTPSA